MGDFENLTISSEVGVALFGSFGAGTGRFRSLAAGRLDGRCLVQRRNRHRGYPGRSPGGGGQCRPADSLSPGDIRDSEAIAQDHGLGYFQDGERSAFKASHCRRVDRHNPDGSRRRDRSSRGATGRGGQRRPICGAERGQPRKMGWLAGIRNSGKFVHLHSF